MLAGTNAEEGCVDRGRIGGLSHTDTLRSPWPPADVQPLGETVDRGVDEGTLALVSSLSLDRSMEMVMFPQ